MAGNPVPVPTGTASPAAWSPLRGEPRGEADRRSVPKALAADGTPLWDGYVSGKDHDLRRDWGLKLAHFDAVLEVQGNRCPICEQPFTDRRRPVVDDDHDTGEFCGLPCDQCNRKLNERMRRYVLAPPARQAARRFGVDQLVIPSGLAADKARRRAERNKRRRRARAEAKPPVPISTGKFDRLGPVPKIGGR